MAKFCGQCGEPLNTGEKKCSQCGAPVHRVDMEADVKRRKQKKGAFKYVVALGIVLVVVIAVAISIIPKHTEYNALADQAMTALIDQDIDTLVLLASDSYAENKMHDAQSYFALLLNMYHGSAKLELGNDYEMSYTLDEIYEPSEEVKDVLFHRLEFEVPNFDENNIEEIMVSQVALISKNGKGARDDTVGLVMVKENDEWKVLYMERAIA